MPDRKARFFETGNNLVCLALNVKRLHVQMAA